MGLFSSSISYLGIDIGTSSIKMVEIENYKSQARLRTYGYADVAINILNNSNSANNDLIATYLNKIAQEAKVQTRQVIAALPTYAVFNFIITLPPMPKKDLADAITWEAKKFIPVPLEEMILSWIIVNKKQVKDGKIEDNKSKTVSALADENLGLKLDKTPSAEDELNDITRSISNGKSGVTKGFRSKNEQGFIKSKNDDKNYRILLTAAPRNLVTRYMDIFRKAKFNLLSLETEAFALSRSLIGNDLSSVMIVDIGANTADICIIEEGVPILNRSIDFGGESITKTIMNSLNVNHDRAEQFKRDFGLAGGENSNVPEVIQRSLNSITNEIKYVFELYKRQGNSRIDKIILTGGSAFLPNLTDYLSKLLSIQVIIGDPWDRIIYPLDLKPVLEEIGPRMAAAVGLAMRDI